MQIRLRGVTAGTLAAWGVAAAVFAQAQAQAPAAAGEYQKQIDALRAQVTTMQRDLNEIKALLAPLRGPQPADDLLIDLGSRPVRGSRDARLTLVELTDYQ
jgi:hypothetical protein